MRGIVVAVLLMALGGCALLKQGVQEAKGGIEPNAEAIPKGEGWYCAVASDMKWHSCSRTLEGCTADLESNKKAARTQGRFDLKFKDCMQAVSAQCFTRNTMEMQSNGSAKPEPGAECMPDQMSCNSLAEDFRSQSKYQRVSKCIATN